MRLFGFYAGFGKLSWPGFHDKLQVAGANFHLMTPGRHVANMLNAGMVPCERAVVPAKVTQPGAMAYLADEVREFPEWALAERRYVARDVRSVVNYGPARAFARSRITGRRVPPHLVLCSTGRGDSTAGDVFDSASRPGEALLSVYHALELYMLDTPWYARHPDAWGFGLIVNTPPDVDVHHLRRLLIDLGGNVPALDALIVRCCKPRGPDQTGGGHVTEPSDSVLEAMAIASRKLRDGGVLV